VKWKLGQNGWGFAAGWSTEVLASYPGAEFQHTTFSRDGRFLIVAGHYRSMILELAAPERTVEFF